MKLFYTISTTVCRWKLNFDQRVLFFCQCSTTCGLGAVWRTVKCSSNEDSHCENIKRPDPARRCHLRPCTTWKSGNWSKVSILANFNIIFMLHFGADQKKNTCLSNIDRVQVHYRVPGWHFLECRICCFSISLLLMLSQDIITSVCVF